MPTFVTEGEKIRIDASTGEYLTRVKCWFNLSAFHQDDHFYLARKSQVLHLRARFIQRIRSFFIKQDFLEVEKPIRIPSPAPEKHIEAIPSGNRFLQTSP
jgi:elongation factor P--beta-lysine ligase